MMPPDCGYVRARELRTERFGDSHKIEEAWLRRATDGPAVMNNSKQLRKFADELRTCMETLSAMGVIQEVTTRRELVKLIERLPYPLRARLRHNILFVCMVMKCLTIIPLQNRP